MAGIPENFGAGGRHLGKEGAHGSPGLDTLLKNLNHEGRIDWTTGIVVASDTATLAHAGFVLAVDATAAGATGAKSQMSTGTPAAGEVKVEYDADGVATLTFAAADAVTAAAVLLQRYGKDLT